MFSPNMAKNGRNKCAFAAVRLSAICFLLLLKNRCACADTTAAIVKVQSGTPTSTTTGDDFYFEQGSRNVVVDNFIQMPAWVKGKLLGANVRPVCEAALRRTFRAFENVEPWALRLFDASGKYPTGFVQLSRVDLGAFDACIETEVRGTLTDEVSRGQYCNLELSFKNFTIWETFLAHFSDVIDLKVLEYKDLLFHLDTHHIRIGICFLDDCSQQDVQAIADSVTPSVMVAEVSHCATSEPEPWERAQIGIVVFLGFLAVTVICATSIDLFTQSRREQLEKNGLLLALVTTFSVTTNTSSLFPVGDKTNPNSLQFVHGLRFLGLAHIVFGHCYASASDVRASVINILRSAQRWENIFIAASFNCTDTFFFISGFFLCLMTTGDQKNGLGVFVIAVLRRVIRVCIPLFFVLMCFHVVPHFVNGPYVNAFFERFYIEVNNEWWRLLLQIRNYFTVDLLSPLFHLWYLSADFQLRITSLLVLMTLKNRRAFAIGVFIVLSLLGCAISAWTAADPDIPPVGMAPTFTFSAQYKAMSSFYIRPSYHAVSYFSGCIAFFIADELRNWKMSRGTELAGWCIAVSSVLCVSFMKIPWHRSPDPTSQIFKLLVAASDRVLWSFFFGWITFSCYTGRGGVVNRFLSWNTFVPLSKLSFGVYLIHYPFMSLVLHASRERLHASHFNQVSWFFAMLAWSLLLAYVLFLMCEAPTAALDKMAFRALNRKWRGERASRPDADGKAAEGKQKGIDSFRSLPDSDLSSANPLLRKNR